MGQPVVRTFEHQHITLASQNSSVEFTKAVRHLLSLRLCASGASEKQVSLSLVQASKQPERREREKGWTRAAGWMDKYMDGGPACTRRGAGWGGRRAHMW